MYIHSNHGNLALKTFINGLTFAPFEILYGRNILLLRYARLVDKTYQWAEDMYLIYMTTIWKLDKTAIPQMNHQKIYGVEVTARLNNNIRKKLSSNLFRSFTTSCFGQKGKTSLSTLMMMTAFQFLNILRSCQLLLKPDVDGARHMT